ncbi:hypothetical protein BofuT4_P123120.1 [Botrytis cinerea T4]|uniref:Uncharacterized protein n=1 Tax=Botryotinia fuckeliana (strain T4) TaxID=999810 RepID=G2YNU5_BOTF4|nr:hypothetical protein BofuT4_P123120.1 [Botrytis cinerea T4]
MSYNDHLCKPNAYPPTCPFRKEEIKHLERKCVRCLKREGFFITNESHQNAKTRRLSEAAEIRKGTILTLKRLEQAEEFVKEEKRQNMLRRRHTEKGDKTRKCVIM